VFLVLGWSAGWWLLWRVPRLRAATGSAAGERDVATEVTVVIPARDEEASLPLLLASLAGQRVRPGQIVVVDDGSTDGTASIARSFPGVTLVPGTPLPEGWTGKTWALHQGVQQARGRLLVFLDADVRLAPDALGALLEEHRRRTGLLSVQPFHRTERPYERLAALFNVISVMGVGMASPGRRGRAHAAFGPCLVTTRDDYDRVGGHAAVRGEIIEDVALGRRYDEVGLPVTALGGGGLVAFRMYPDGLGQLVEGFSKNMATGAGSVPVLRTALVFAWIVAALTGVQVVAGALVGSADALAVPFALAVFAAFALQLGVMLRQLGDFGWPVAALYPVPLAMFVVVFARSVWLTVVRRRVEWRGRPIPLARDRRWAAEPVVAEP
jgi:4,4'-diaponeurosporenoate glycosyltransferase